MFLCQPFRHRQDIYVVSHVFFNDKINSNFIFTCNKLNLKENKLLINLVVFLLRQCIDESGIKKCAFVSCLFTHKPISGVPNLSINIKFIA